jgi:hypothetical protein
VHELRTERAINDMIIHTNTMSSIFSKAGIDVKYKLFKCYCMSLYGSVLWDMSHKSMSRVHITWRKCIRKLFWLPSRTHCELLPLICNDLPVSLQLCKRSVKFIIGALNSNNECVKICAQSALNGSYSSSGNNLNHVAQLLSMSKHSMVRYTANHINKLVKDSYKPSDQATVTAFQIRDLVSLRSGGHANFSRDDFETMLNYLCCV